MRSIADYVAKIPPLNAGKANFVATITAVVSSFADNQTFLNNLPAQFDLDLAVGAQLDAVGQWVGRSRHIPVIILTSWFSWDIVGLGWESAPWQDADVRNNRVIDLDDTSYRRLLRSKIIVNDESGFIADAQRALSQYFLPPTLIFVCDRTPAIQWLGVEPYFTWDNSARGWEQGFWFDPNALTQTFVTPSQPNAGMYWQIGVAGAIPSNVDLAILGRDLIPIDPAGVFVETFVTTVDSTPLFGFDIANAYVSGWGAGAWGASPDYVAQNTVR